MKARAALDAVRPDAWIATSAKDRLEILRRLQRNMLRYAPELAAADGRMKNGLVGETVFAEGLNLNSTVGLIGGAVAATIDLYRSIVAGEMMAGKQVTAVGNGTFDVEVWPQTAKDRLTAGSQRGYLRTQGRPHQVDPFDKPAGIIVVLGAGNYSASIETVKALFWENKAVIHRPHQLNRESDAVWQRVFEPLVAIGALAFADADQGRSLTQLPGITAIYFTGGTESAKAIMASTSTRLVAECGGNNPCIVVPGDRAWTDREITHQAQQFVSLAKVNGGAVCGRAQTLVTSRHWPQREQFLAAVRTAFTDETPASSSYYPGSDLVLDRFASEYPDAERLPAERGRFSASDGLLITDAEPDGFAARNEAFCQVIGEIALDVPADAAEFLPAAVDYCNDRLLGSLAAMLVVDEDTKKAHRRAVDDAVTELRYGAVAVNAIPPLIFGNPYLIWGGNEEGRDFVSGSGNFGNLLQYEHVEKAVFVDQFVSMTHFLNTKKRPFDQVMAANARFMMHPTWANLTRMTGSAVRANLARKDF